MILRLSEKCAGKVIAVHTMVVGAMLDCKSILFIIQKKMMRKTYERRREAQIENSFNEFQHIRTARGVHSCYERII